MKVKRDPAESRKRKRPPGTPPTEEAAKQEVAVQPEAPKPATTDSAARVRAEINGMIRENHPRLTKAYNEALQKEADKQAMKNNPKRKP